MCTIAGAEVQTFWIRSHQSLGGAEDCMLQQPGAPIPSDEAAQALEDRQTAGSHAGLASWGWVGRKAQSVPFILGCRWEKSQPFGRFPEEGFADPRWQAHAGGPHRLMGRQRVR